MNYVKHKSHEMDETSLETYEEIKYDLPSRRDKVWAVLDDFGEASAEQIADRLNWDKFHVMPRITELRKEGKVDKTGKRRLTRANKSENIWELV